MLDFYAKSDVHLQNMFLKYISFFSRIYTDINIGTPSNITVAGGNLQYMFWE